MTIMQFGVDRVVGRRDIERRHGRTVLSDDHWMVVEGGRRAIAARRPGDLAEVESVDDDDEESVLVNDVQAVECPERVQDRRVWWLAAVRIGLDCLDGVQDFPA